LGLNMEIKMPNINFDFIHKYRRDKPKRKMPGKVVAVDVGSFALKLIEVKLGKNPEITKVVYHPWSQAVVNADEEEVFRNPYLFHEFAQVLQDHHIKNRDFYVAAASKDIIMRPFIFPASIPTYEIRKLLEFNIEDQIPYPLEDVYYDYSVVKRDDKGLHIQTFATQRFHVDNMISFYNALQRNLRSVNIYPMMLRQAIEINNEATQSSNSLLIIVNIGAAQTEIVIYGKSEILFLRTIDLGGDNFTVALSHYYEGDGAEIERVKHENGLIGAMDLPEVMGVQNELFNNIWDAIQYVTSRNQNYEVFDIMLTGGSASLKGLASKLRRFIEVQVHNPSDMTMVEVQVFNPFQNLNVAADIDLEAYRTLISSFAAVVGLAYGGV